MTFRLNHLPETNDPLFIDRAEAERLGIVARFGASGELWVMNGIRPARALWARAPRLVLPAAPLADSPEEAA